MNYYAIILAGGKGNRMQNDIPKHFLRLNGKAILSYSLEKFYQAISGIRIILVLGKNEIPKWEMYCKQENIVIPHQITEGGPERFHSVKNGLSLVKNNGIIAIHDAARPLLSIDLIKRCFNHAEKHTNAIPAIAVKDSLRQLDGALSNAVKREDFRIIQTPQCFKSESIIEAYRQAYSTSFTDDASVLEKLGKPIHLIQGEEDNIKITYPSDMKFAEAILS